MATDEARVLPPPTDTEQDLVGEQVIIWTGIGWDGFETFLEVRGESRRPRILYLDGNLTLVSRDYSRNGGDQVMFLSQVGWDGYEKLLRLPATGSPPRLQYLDGNVTLMAPSHIHELWADRLGSFVRELVVALDIPCLPTRRTIFKGRYDDVGFQPDDSFYLANLAPVVARGRRSNIDLRIDPPPDLIIEFVENQDADWVAAESFRRLGIPEVWIGDANGLRFLVRDEIGQYQEAPQSLSFPFLTATEVFHWAARTDLDLFPAWARALRRWIAEVVMTGVSGSNASGSIRG